MIMRREWAMPNKNTFSILPIQNLLYKYCRGEVIVEPFANTSKWGTIRNDLNPEYDTQYHMDALEFLRMFDDASVDVVLYDPPFSIHQSQECYKSYGAEKAERRAEVAMRALLDCMKDSRPVHCSIAICSKWTRCGDDTCVETRRAIFIEQAEREIKEEKGE